jgi:endonuclease/exonuclease/phosphatase family metal-dependent hydrolase
MSQRIELYTVLIIVLVLSLVAMAAVPRPTGRAQGGPIAVPGDAEPAPRSLLRLATFNIHGGMGVDGRRDLERISSVIRDAEVVALQEVRDDWWRKNQAARMATRHRAACLYAPTRRRWLRAHRGNALLSRYPVIDWRREPLPDLSGRRFRNFTVARIDVRGRTLSVMFTHLHTRAGREEQLQRVLAHFRTLKPAVLLGDLNTAPGDTLLSDYLAEDEVVDALQGTDNAQAASDRVDWILCRGVAVHASGTSPAGPSDHPYYWADVEISET